MNLDPKPWASDPKPRPQEELLDNPDGSERPISLQGLVPGAAVLMVRCIIIGFVATVSTGEKPIC